MKSKRPGHFKSKPEYPVGTVAYYGPDDHKATKVAVGIILKPQGEVEHLKRWFGVVLDVREDEKIQAGIQEYLAQYQVKTVVAPPQILGCPHEEGIDYPEGMPCPKCPFWANRDRWDPPPQN